MLILSSFANPSSEFVRFLLTRLFMNGKNHNKFMKQLLNEQKCRISLQRMRKMPVAGIPHPIFSRVRLDCRLLANILFARSPQMLQMRSDCLQRQLSLEFSPLTVHYLREVFTKCIHEQKPFVLKLALKDGDILMLHFSPRSNNMWVLTLTKVKLNTCVADTLIDRYEVSVIASLNTGVKLITKHSVMTFLYSTRINLGIHMESLLTLVGMELYCSSEFVINSNDRKRRLPPTELSVVLKKMHIAPNI